MTTSPLASPVDVERFGEYRITRQPQDQRPLYRFEGRISTDGTTPFTPEAGRYHVYSGWFCPWAQRVTIVHALAGLDDIVSVSYVDGARDARGWGFRGETGPDPINGFTLLREAYDLTEPHFDGHISVPTLWDRTTGTVASNQFKTIGIDLATRFGALAQPRLETYPAELAAEIEALDAWLGPLVNQGANRAATDATARDALHGAFTELDARLAGDRFLLGERLTEADIRLFVTLVRFDAGVNADGAAGRRVDSYPNLWAYARDLYRTPGFRETTRFESFIRAGATLPEWDSPVDRGRPVVGASA
jgi:putative glutathione S-transferase